MKRTLFLPIFIVFLLGLTVPLAINWKIFNDSIVSDTQDATEREVKLLTNLFVQQAEISKDSALNLLTTIASSQIRATLIDEKGVVLFDSQVASKDLPSVENHFDREEVQEAIQFGTGSAKRTSSTIGQSLIYVAQKIEATKSFPAGFLRLAVPTSIVLDRIDSLMYSAATILAIVLALLYILSYLFNKKWTTAIDQFQEIIDNTANNKQEELSKTAQNLPPTEEFKSLSYAISEMNARVKNQIITINKQKNELEGILNSINAGVMLLDNRSFIALYNKAFYTLLPNSFAQNDNFYVGKKSLEVLNSPDLEDIINKLLSENTNYISVQLELEAKTFQINITKSLIQSEFSQEVQLLLVFHDITQLAQLVTIKRELIANVSHELRTPLTAIQGYTETLQSVFAKADFDKEQSQHFLQIILKNTKHLDRIVNDLLSLSSLESKDENNNSDPATTDIQSPFTMALEECKALLEQKNIKLENHMDMSITLPMDADRLSQVFRNLLENAIRYSPENESIILKTFIEGNQCSIYVQDFGVGIPKEDLVRVFERFYRVEKHRTSNGSISTGLGLAICKHIVEKANGSIFALYRAPFLIDNITPEKMVGATMRINLPLSA